MVNDLPAIAEIDSIGRTYGEPALINNNNKNIIFFSLKFDVVGAVLSK